MKKDGNWLKGFIFEQKCVPLFIIQIYRKLFLFAKTFLKDPAKARGIFRYCFNRQITAGGLSLFLYGDKLLKDCVEVCEAAGVKPFLVFGTLLGYVRENNFISHDHDIDLGLLDVDFQKKILIKELLMKKGYRQRLDNPYEFSLIHPEYPFTFIDFWRVFDKDNRTVIGMLSEDGKNTLFSYYFPPDSMSQFQEVNFHNNRVRIPVEPAIFLKACYGEWQVPQKNYHYIFDSNNMFVNDVKLQKLHQG